MSKLLWWIVSLSAADLRLLIGECKVYQFHFSGSHSIGCYLSSYSGLNGIAYYSQFGVAASHHVFGFYVVVRYPARVQLCQCGKQLSANLLNVFQRERMRILIGILEQVLLQKLYYNSILQLHIKQPNHSLHTHQLL